MIYMIAHSDFNNQTDYQVLNVWNCPLGIKDTDGDNIHELNPWINECTGMYWIWKNTYDDIIGMCHYRRWLSIDGVPINENDLGDYDMLTAQKVDLKMSIYEHLKTTHNFDPKLFDEVYSDISKRVDLSLFDKLDYIYPCNIFLMRRELFDKYCEWVFKIIIEPAKTLMNNGINSRIVGYFAERLLTIFIIENNLNVKELNNVV